VAVCVALALTAATIWTGVSLVSRVVGVYSQRQLILRHLKDIEKYWEAAKTLPEDTAGFADVTGAIRLATEKQEVAITTEAAAAAALGVLRKTINDNLAHISSKLSVIEGLQQEFEAEFGRRVEFRPGPPPTYDAGPEPVLYGPDWLRISMDAGLGTGRSHVRHAKWVIAHKACTNYNAASATLYPLIAQSQQEAELAEQKQRDAAAFLADCGKRLEELRMQLKPFTESPPEVIPEIDRLRRRLANSWPVLAVFGLSDLLALIPCGIASVLAWSRVALIANGFAPRQLSRV
jgi:hypothetical protein